MFEKLTNRTPGYLDQELYKKYAVIAPFLPETKEFLFQVRSDKLNRQPGEICFPGGYIEPGETPLVAAVRETVEELLIPKENIQVIAPLDILVTPYYHTVVPYLANIIDYTYTYNSDEVQEVFTVPFSFFLKNEPMISYTHTEVAPEDPAHMYSLLEMETYPWTTARNPVFFYPYQRWMIWGMTARFIHNIVTLYQNT